MSNRKFEQKTKYIAEYDGQRMEISYSDYLYICNNKEKYGMVSITYIGSQKDYETTVLIKCNKKDFWGITDSLTV